MRFILNKSELDKGGNQENKMLVVMSTPKMFSRFSACKAVSKRNPEL